MFGEFDEGISAIDQTISKKTKLNNIVSTNIRKLKDL